MITTHFSFSFMKGPNFLSLFIFTAPVHVIIMLLLLSAVCVLSCCCQRCDISWSNPLICTEANSTIQLWHLLLNYPNYRRFLFVASSINTQTLQKKLRKFNFFSSNTVYVMNKAHAQEDQFFPMGFWRVHLCCIFRIIYPSTASVFLHRISSHVVFFLSV